MHTAIWSSCAVLLESEQMPFSQRVHQFRSAALDRIQLGTCWFVHIPYFYSETNGWSKYWEKRWALLLSVTSKHRQNFQDSIWNVPISSYALFYSEIDVWLKDWAKQWVWLTMASVCNSFWQLHWKFHFIWGKKSSVTPQNLQSIKPFFDSLTLELSQFSKSGSTWASDSWFCLSEQLSLLLPATTAANLETPSLPSPKLCRSISWHVLSTKTWNASALSSLSKSI